MLNAADYFSMEERRELLKKNNWKASFEIIHTWSWIVAVFVVVGYFPNVLTIVIGLFILGGKQLACAIIMHDASHSSMFTNRKVNDFVGKWLGAFPIWNNMLRYRPYHIKHHVSTGTIEDPDIGFTLGYPTTERSMTRKVLRDLFGLTGLKTQLVGNIATHLGLIEYNLGGAKVQRIEPKNRSVLKSAIQNLTGPILANFLLFILLWLFGNAWLYLLWLGALLTTFNFSLRIRSIAEHALVENAEDPIRNTRTTYANWLERMLFAPHHVNYHLEHHMLMSVPSYHLPQMHRKLKERGFYEKGLLEHGYWNIIKQCIK